MQYTGNSKKIDEFGVGNRGIILYNSGTGFYAFDGACPNQELSSCSTLEISGATATCPCDDAIYSLLDGRSPGLQYPLKQKLSNSWSNCWYSNKSIKALKSIL